MNQFTPNATLINRELAERAHSGTSWTPDIRRDQEIAAFIGDIESMHNELIKTAKNESEMDIIDAEMITFQERYAQKYNDKLSAQSRCISSMIAGPSNFPTRRAEKANASYEKRFEELMDFRKRAVAAIHKRIRAHRIDEAGGESEIMKDKIADAEKMQMLMKGCNKIIRSKKLSDEEKTTKMISEFGLSEQTIKEIMAPDYMTRVGFAPYQMSNNNANIRRMGERLKELQAKEATPTSEIEFNGGSIIDNAEEDRVQIDFDEKPGDAMRTKLKGSGWRWAPSVGMWQRKRTPAAMTSAKQITEA